MYRAASAPDFLESCFPASDLVQGGQRFPFPGSGVLWFLEINGASLT